MDRYELLLFGHILGAIVWVGGSVALQVVATRVVASGDPQRLVQSFRDFEWIGPRLFMPASLLVLGLGVWLVSDAGWGYDEEWIIGGLAAFGVSFVNGAAFLSPETKRINQRIDDHGADDLDVTRRIRRVLLASRIELAVLIVVVFLMATKPGT